MLMLDIANNVQCISTLSHLFLASYPQKTRAQWQIIFYISAAIIVFGSLFYLVFGTGVEQEWAKEPEDEETEALTQEGENGSIQVHSGQDDFSW